MFVVLLLILGLSGLGTVVGIAKAYVETAPNLNLAKIDEQAETSFFYDRDGNFITDFKGTENRIMVNIAQMPERLRNAFVAVEDARFYTHNGVDIKRIAGAFIKNFLTGSQQGGSTITQQLIKNTLLSNELSYKRKIQEAYLAMQLETRYSKDEILESYLNTIYLGENYYGVKVAAMGFFGKELHELSLRECAMLAGMTTNPYYYNCRRNFYTRQSDSIDYPAITNNRTNYVLRQMYEKQFITHDEYRQALDLSTAHVLRESPENKDLYPYPHYVEYAVQDVIDTFLRIKGLENTRANRNRMERELRTGGYKVYLALDTQIQKTVEDTLYNYKNYPKLRNSKDNVYRAHNKDGTFEEIIQPQASATVIDYRTGEIKAIVGSRTPPTVKRTLNRATDMSMPVGSAIKPLSVYAPAFELGVGGGSVVYNMPLPIAGWTGADGKDSWPKNYGGGGYKGPETMRTALVKSNNTSTARALMEYVGLDRSVDFLKRLGIDERHINATPFGLSLGSSGPTSLEMSVAFGVLGNGGIYQRPLSFIGILDRNDEVIYDAHADQERRQVFSPAASYLTVDVLKQAVTNGTGRSARIKGQTVAGKTGTNSEQKGVCFSGLTGWYSASVWIGHDNYKALSSKTTGGNSAAKIWQNIMEKIHKDKSLQNRDILDGSPEDYALVKVRTCAVSGQLATDACSQDALGYGTVTDYIRREAVPTVKCQMHETATLCSQSNMLAGEFCPINSRINKSIVILPAGHPLQSLIGTQYENTLADYLGPYSNLAFTGDTARDRAMLSAHTCPIHNSPMDSQQFDPMRDMLRQDAELLLNQAGMLLGSIPQEIPEAQNLLSAMNALTQALAQNADGEQIANAMAALTQAMAAVQY
ncbi:MAG: transglycosylase domain-containing protein [Eubacteriales bacterium]|nr:transglycosylase domain-containing protein [Eubacteriales bacterium]